MDARRRPVSLLVVALTLACAAVVGAGDDHARARAAHKAGEIVSLRAILSLGVLAIALFAAAAIQVRVGLRPLHRLRAGVAAIREGRIKRLEGPFPTET